MQLKEVAGQQTCVAMTTAKSIQPEKYLRAGLSLVSLVMHEMNSQEIERNAIHCNAQNISGHTVIYVLNRCSPRNLGENHRNFNQSRTRAIAIPTLESRFTGK